MIGSDFASGIARILAPIVLFALAFSALGVWKAVEIVIWICHHVHFGATP